jgi:hypothetical protein
MASTYTLALLRGGNRGQWSRVIPFTSDADAIAAAGRIAEAAGRRSPEQVSLRVGRSADGHVSWLGGWGWAIEGALSWDAEDAATGFKHGA